MITHRDEWSPIDDVAVDVDRAVWRWFASREPDTADLDALADLTTACEWLLQQPAAAEARAAERRKGGRNAVMGCLVLGGVIVGVSATIVGLLWLMLQVAP